MLKLGRFAAPLLVASLLVALASGCTIHPMPIKSPSPRSFVLPHLLQQCMKGIKAPAVELEDAGAEPRAELRYVPLHEQEAALLFRPIERQADHYDVTISWSSIGGAGQNCYELVMRGAQDAEMDEDHPIMGVIGIGPHGATTVATDALDDESYLAEGELFWRMTLLQPRLPTDAVGVGARWRYKNDGRLRGEYIDIDISYTLVSRRGSHLVLEIDRAIRRPAQTVRGREGESLRVDDRIQSDRGVVDIDLRERIFPAVRLFDEKGREAERILTAYRPAS